MTPEQKELARHALGLPNSRRQSYRNRFVTGANNAAWTAMVAAGEAKLRDVSMIAFEGSSMFWLTLKGAQSALEKGERLCPEDFPDEVPLSKANRSL